MGVSCAVLYEAANDSFVRFLEDDVPELLSHLQQLELVIGFNIKGFDYHVLQAYSHYSLDGLPTLDLLERVFRRLGYRISLDNLAQATLGIKKNGQGLQAIEWWKQGEIEKLVHYCEQDVRITHNLYLFGQEYGYLMFENKARSKVKIIVDWE
jgi:DEAD/DEAH box helicase domain-containing protein